MSPAIDVNDGTDDNIIATPGENNSAIPTRGGDEIYPLSLSNDVDLEKQRHSGVTTSSDNAIHDHVDIQYAERQFADLKQRYSNLSRVTSGTSQQSQKRPRTSDGIEKEVAGTEEEIESEDEFDLEDVLRDRHRKEVEHDIKPKHLGIQSVIAFTDA
jgi:hypothetical protein